MFLKTYDKAVKKRASEESRRKRLEYVNISFANIIKEESEQKKQAKPRSRSLSSSDESSEESEENDEPLYQLRVRRQVNVRHRLNEYEELMNSAIEVSKLRFALNENLFHNAYLILNNCRERMASFR